MCAAFFVTIFFNFQGDEPKFTNHEGSGRVWTLDYMWFDSASLKVTAALETVSKEAIEPYEGPAKPVFLVRSFAAEGTF